MVISFKIRKRKLWFLTRCLSLMAIVGCQKQASEIRVAQYVIQRNLTTDEDSSYLLPILSQLLKGTRFKNEIQINRAYNSKMVNLYLIDGTRSAIVDDGVVSQLINNCNYVGRNIIFLDVNYLNNFLAMHHVTPDPKNEELMDDQPAFLYWAVGHELGHLLCGHLHGQLDTGPLDKFVKTSTLVNKQELQAIVPVKYLRYSEERLMINMLNAEIKEKIGNIQTMGVGIIYDYTNTQIVTYAKQPTHPEYVIRLSRMLDLSTKMGKDTGLNNLVGGFIRQLKEVK
jgi:hypothetical protein